MVGIALTPQRRSQLLELLLSQQSQTQQNPQTALEAALRLGAQGIRQRGINELGEREAAATKRRGSKEAALLSALSGGGATDFQGRAITDQQGNQQPGNVQAQLSQLLTQNPDSPIGQAIASAQIQQAFTPEPEKKDTRTSLQKDFEFAVRDGFTGSFTDFISKTRRSTIEKPGGFKVPNGFMHDPNDPNRVIPIPGGPKDTLTPEAAAKVQLLESALESSTKFKEFIFNDDSSVNRVNVLNAFANTPFTEGRVANTFLLDSIEAKLRAESGAAVPDTEVARAGKRFRPNPFDSDAGIEVKANLLSSFLEGAFDKTQRDGRFDLDATVSSAENLASEQLIALGDELIDTSKIPGFSDLSPEDQQLVIDQLIKESTGAP